MSKFGIFGPIRVQALNYPPQRSNKNFVGIWKHECISLKQNYWPCQLWFCSVTSEPLSKTKEMVNEDIWSNKILDYQKCHNKVGKQRDLCHKTEVANPLTHRFLEKKKENVSVE